MEMTGFFSVLGVGIVIGLIARILVPSMQPIGCLMTIIQLFQALHCITEQFIIC